MTNKSTGLSELISQLWQIKIEHKNNLILVPCINFSASAALAVSDIPWYGPVGK